MSETEKSTHGGKRPGAGQPKKEETGILNFRLPKSKIKTLRRTYGKKLNTMFKEWTDNLLPDDPES